MKQKRNLLIVGTVGVICLIAARLAVSIPDRPFGHTQDRAKTYEVDPWITTPEYKTDTTRAIDAYERLMERYMDLSERYLVQSGIDYQAVTQRLDSIDAKMENLSARLARIEKALGIEPNNTPAAKAQPSEVTGSTNTGDIK